MHYHNIKTNADSSKLSPQSHAASNVIRHGWHGPVSEITQVRQQLHGEHSHLDPHASLDAHLGTDPCLLKPDALEHCAHNSQTRSAPPHNFCSATPPSYAQAVCPPTSPSAVAVPTKKGDYFVVSIDDELYRRQIEKCKQSFIGRVSYAPGDKPHTLTSLKNNLQKIWNTKGDFRIAHLGRGYYNISLASQEDRKQVGARSSWAISPGLIRLSLWTPGFNPYKLNSSTSQVWLRIYELPFEFWHKSVILGIARAVGKPIKIDDRSLDGSVGHYVRVLVEVDLATPIHMEVMVDGPEYCDMVHLQFENLPLYCPNCKLVGHSVTNCFKLTRNEEKQSNQQNSSENKTISKSPIRGGVRGRQRSRSRLVYRQVDKSKDSEPLKNTTPPSLPSEVVTANTFAALAELENAPEDPNEVETVRQTTVGLSNTNVKEAANITSSNMQSSHAESTARLLPPVQRVPKSILKKPRRDVPGIRLGQFNSLSEEERNKEPGIAEARPSTFSGVTQHQSWADLADDNQADESSSHTEAKEKAREDAISQSNSIVPNSTQDIIDHVRGIAAANFRIQRPIAEAGQAMRIMVTKNWRGDQVANKISVDIPTSSG